MSQATTIGLVDIAKHVCHAHGADERGGQVFSRRSSRGKLLELDHRPDRGLRLFVSLRPPLMARTLEAAATA